ncbi:MAG: rhodanese-like domain-containing protein, partial [Planctomycetota bacterium]
ESGRLAGAMHIPLHELRGRVGELPGDQSIVTYCQKGQRGYLAACALQGLGFERVANLRGGFLQARLNGWRLENVLAACNRQLVVGKALRTGQQLAVLASSAAGVAVLIWLLLPGTAPPATRSGPATQTDSLLSSPGIPPGAALSLPSPAPSLGNMAATNAAPAAPPTTAPPDAHSPKTAPLPASPPQQQPARP